MIFVAIAIKCDSRGPVFAWEERISTRGLRFSALKFRTTGVHSSARRGAASELTFVGGIIWHLRLDNLPQLLNVLRGEMSCIKRDSDRPFFLD
jgi:lipopolysaccharide/colanic/teichoic acid biosynthesis glycosyltransferase